MKRGIVMQIEKHYLIAMTPEGQFTKAAKSPDNRIGDEITIAPVSSSNRRFAFWGSVGAAALLLVMLSWLLVPGHQVVAYVSLDINPSLEVGIDNGKRVRELRAWNEEGENVIDGMLFSGLPVEKVIKQIMERFNSAAYLEADYRDVIVTSVLVSDSERLSDGFETGLVKKLEQVIKEALAGDSFESDNNIRVTFLQAPASLRDAAVKEGVTSGKLAVYLLVKNSGGMLTMDNLKQGILYEVAEAQGGLQEILKNMPFDGEGEKLELERLLDQEKQQAQNQEKAADNREQQSEDEQKLVKQGYVKI
ncbi:anti-sigma factor domain-containing protein [Paenibacillaceae bacterium]|nr:anti-sigma factor domain-containing protein [Paenibacillaceae bacterium]